MKKIALLTVMILLAVAACGPMLPDAPVNAPQDVKEWVKSSEDPAEPADPADPDNPADPTDPVDPVDPTDPVQPDDPVDPVDPVDPEDPVEPEEPDTIEIGGTAYHIAQFPDGRWWMTENLRYVPEGAEFGKDIFYPCKDTAAEYDESEEAVAAKGLLYADYLAFGTEVTVDNYEALEGVQGICPDGWHIPTAPEWMALVGKSVKAELYPTITTAVYYDTSLDSGSIELMEQAGFNPIHCGYSRNGSAGGYLASYDKITMSYYYGSSVYHSVNSQGVHQCQFFSLMLSGTNGKASVATQNSAVSTGPIAGAVRCIKNE